MKKKQFTIKNIILENRLFKSRCFFALGIIILFVFLLIGRLCYLQIKEHRTYASLSAHNLLSIIPVRPNRGLIYDRNGVLLAKNIPSYTLSIIPKNKKDTKNTIQRLSRIIPISKEEIAQFFHKSYQYRPHQPVPLKDKLSDEEVARFYVNQIFFPSVNIETRMIRYYPLKELMSDVIGYVGKVNQKELDHLNAANYLIDDDIGKTGIEKYYEDKLRGRLGSKEAEINARGRIIQTLKTNSPEAGHNLYLTIDSELQKNANEALGEDSGGIVAIEPSTGDVLALVTKPGFDPNPFVSGISHEDYKKLLTSPDHPLYNRAIRGQFSPGSTIKPFFGLFGLDNGFVTPTFQIHDPGVFQIPGAAHVYRDWRKYGHGIVNLAKAIAESCDIYFYQLAYKTGIDTMSKNLRLFGFGEKTGIDLPEEIPGIVPDPAWKMKTQGQKWYIGDTIVVGIGQGFLSVTPLQLARAVTVIANRGLKLKPHLLLKTVNPDGISSIQEPIFEKPVQLKNPKNWDIIIKDMQGVINSPGGTARYFKTDGFQIAAKTGTAQVYGGLRDENKNNLSVPKKYRNNHLFIAFAPVDHPKIALAVIVEHSSTAAKIANELILNYLHNQTSNYQRSEDNSNHQAPTRSDN